MHLCYNDSLIGLKYIKRCNHDPPSLATRRRGTTYPPGNRRDIHGRSEVSTCLGVGSTRRPGGWACGLGWGDLVVSWFLSTWTLLGIASILFRNRMIYQERNQGYRATLLILTLPARIATDILFQSFQTIRGTYWFFSDSLNGIDPAERNAPSPTDQGEKK